MTATATIAGRLVLLRRDADFVDAPVSGGIPRRPPGRRRPVRE
ncbi:MAG TPA: hypothetical protein VFX25_26010 [Streptosporangiaceae bacterium]|nr:hypothetical protein [Streptosporangiaceae bacterium]